MSEPVFVPTALVDAATDNRVDQLYRRGLEFLTRTLREYHSPELGTTDGCPSCDQTHGIYLTGQFDG